MATEHRVPVLVVGGGPVGLSLALQLSQAGLHCMLAERNLETTKWPKMDLTNCRSMEVFNKLGLSKGLRTIGVPENYSFTTHLVSGLSDNAQKLATWKHPSTSRLREDIKQRNDGTQPRESWQRCSLVVLEAWLKTQVVSKRLIDSRFGLKFVSLIETEDGVESLLVNTQTNEQHKVHSQYVVGCDGAGSQVRRSIGVTLTGGPTSASLLLIHFKSRDLTKIHKYGQFWHIFTTKGTIFIAQDEVDTWTIHRPVPSGTDCRDLDLRQVVYEALGDSKDPYVFDIDEILVSSVWQPNLFIADKYMSPGARVILAGDSAHQTVPTGGYGMNTGICDAYEIGWRLIALLRGYGGPHLLSSYENERLPVAVRNVTRSGHHIGLFAKIRKWVAESSPETIYANTPEGEELRTKVADYFLVNDGENLELGVEMGYRYNGSPVIVADTEVEEPASGARHYVPSTWPGARAPHVFLSDGTTSIFDLLGKEYTLVDFSQEGNWAYEFSHVANRLSIPLKVVHLPREPHVARLWERKAVLVRPDDHVAWRSPLDGEAKVQNIGHILKIATGQLSAVEADNKAENVIKLVKQHGFLAGGRAGGYD